MRITNNEELIVTIGGHTKCFSKDFVKEALRAHLTEKAQPTCANYERDSAEMNAQEIIPGKPAKFDSEKTRMELLPPYALEVIAKVFTFGAKKYSPWNYIEGKGLQTSRVYGSLLRHITAWYKGEEKDPETGESHLAHAGCCVMMLIELDKFKNNNDKPQHYDTK